MMIGALFVLFYTFIGGFYESASDFTGLCNGIALTAVVINGIAAAGEFRPLSKMPRLYRVF